MSDALASQTAIISGGLGDIGRAIARELASQGADIALCDLRPPADAETLLNELRSLGRRARPLALRGAQYALPGASLSFGRRFAVDWIAQG